jgi:hypothetical protein
MIMQKEMQMLQQLQQQGSCDAEAIKIQENKE